MSSSVAILSDITTMQDAVSTHLHSSEEEKSTRPLADKEGEGDEFTAVEVEDPDVDLEYPDGGWRAWGVVVGVSRFLPVDLMRV
jgi:hypothetical protein